MTRELEPIAPGEILLTDFMEPHGVSQNRLARELRVPMDRVSKIVHGKRSITVDTALRLGRYFGTTAEFWLNLQAQFDLKIARRAVGDDIEKGVLPRAAQA